MFNWNNSNFNSFFEKMMKDFESSRNDTGGFIHYTSSVFGTDINSITPKKDDPNFEYTIETHETDTFIITQEAWKSKIDTTVYSKKTHTPKVTNADKIKELNVQLKAAVKAEKYETAAQLQKEILKLKGAE